MAKLVWDAETERTYETGVDHGVLYLKKADGTYDNGVAWNGLSSVSESPSGAESTAIYADNIKYLNLVSAEEFGATIEAYTYPDEFAECDGSKTVNPGVYVGQQGRKLFGFVYRSKVGNDTLGNEYSEKLHIIYNCQASPSERQYSTINDSPEAITFSWTITTTPTAVATTGYKPTACITVDKSKADATQYAALEDLLFGTSNSDPSLPTPDTIIDMFD